MPAAQPVQIAGPVVVLCEGAADAAFLAALRTRRGMSPFDLPFPPVLPQPAGEPALHGIDGFGNMLRRLASDARLDRTLWTRVRGIVIVADASGSASGVLNRIASQCGSAGFGAPTATAVWTPSPPPFPQVAALLVPAQDVGGLETLCLDYLRPAHPGVAACVDAYMACVPPLNRTKEKQDKAALACVIAAINRSDPTMTIARAFSGSAPMIDVASPVFTPLADALADLLAGVVVP